MALLLLLGWGGDRRRCGGWDPGFWSSVVVGQHRSARDVGSARGVHVSRSSTVTMMPSNIINDHSQHAPK